MNATLPLRQTFEQQRAADAWDKIQQVTSQQKEYGSLARGLPAMIQVNGLAQTLAFLMAKAGNDESDYHMRLYRHLSTWLGLKIAGRANDNAFLDYLIHNNSETYRRATSEALAYSLWLRRFAEAQGWAEEEQGD